MTIKRKDSSRVQVRCITVVFVLGALLPLAGCAETAELLPAGRCRVNEDCPDGQTCRASYCEDIYHPRKEIKPY